MPNPEHLNQRTMAAACGVSVRNFQNWGVPPAATDGRQKFYTVRAVMDNRLAEQAARYQVQIDRLQARITELETSEDGTTMAEVMLQQNRERTRLLAEQAEGQAMKNAMARHEVAPFDFLTYLLAGVAAQIASVMDGLPGQLIRITGLRPTEVDKVRSITAAASEQIVALGDEHWVAGQFDNYLKELQQ